MHDVVGTLRSMSKRLMRNRERQQTKIWKGGYGYRSCILLMVNILMRCTYATLHYNILGRVRELLPVCTVACSTLICPSFKRAHNSFYRISRLQAFRPSLAVTPSLLSSSSVRVEK